MWKLLFFLAAIVVGSSAGRYEIKGQKRVKLTNALEEACQDYGNQTQVEQMVGLVMGGVYCVSDSFDQAVTKSHRSSQHNATDEQKFLDAVTETCEVRQTLRECAQQILENLAPCVSAPVQAKIGDMKVAITELFKYFCDDDMTRPRRFAEDGAFACIEKNSEQLTNCTQDVSGIFFDMPEDTSSFEAIDMCYKYDTMVSCVLDTLSTCPKPTTKEFFKDVTTLFRSGTFCRVTVPVEQTENAV